jgi:hypothetical protein
MTNLKPFKNFSIWTTVAVQILFFLSQSQNLYGQQLSFKLSHDNILQDNFYLKAFKNNGYQLYKSEDFVMTVDASTLKMADSVRLYYSFYDELFDFNKIEAGVYKLSGQLSLETIVINSNKKLDIFELKGSKNSIIGGSYEASSIEKTRISGSTLHGIELHFEKNGQMRYKGEKLKFSNMDKKFNLIVALSNQRDSIYPDKLPHVSYEFSVTKNGWNYFNLDGFDYNLNDYKYIVVILLQESGSNMGPGIRWLRKKEKGILRYNQRVTDDKKEMYFVKALYLNGEEITDLTLDFKLHYSE